MADRFIIKKDSVLELLRMSHTLYKSFKLINDDLSSSQDTLTSDSELDYSLRPEDYYFFKFGLRSCCIHKMRNSYYTIECRGFTPDGIKPLAYSEETLKLYTDLYGRFSDFGDCLNHYSDCVTQACAVCLKPLF